MGIFNPSLSNVLVAVSLSVVYVVGLYFYRAYFDQLSHIPGPKLAAATLWYEFYYDVVKKGRYTWEIAKMHEKYGPIIRISPYEVHISDPEFIDQVYPGSSVKTEKYSWGMRMFGLKHTHAVVPSHDLHRIRRNNFAHYFSKASLQRLEPRIQSVVDTLIARLKEIKGTGRVVKIQDMYACLTGDVVGQYAFSGSYDLLAHPDFSPYWHDSMMGVSMGGPLLKQFGFLLPLTQAMPEWLVKMILPGMMVILNFQKHFRSQVIKTKQDLAEGGKPPSQTNIFYDILTNPDVRPQEKETLYLQEEAQTIIGAGTVTTGHVLATTHYHIMANPHVLQRLQSELSSLMTKDPTPKWSQLERLPYFTAVITEGLRISYGVSHRLQRLFPDTIIQYKQHAIPTMTPISMTAVLIHDNPSLFPNPRTFKPERFLEDPSLKKYLITFSRGTRQCTGMQLAYAEIYLGLAAMFAPGRFEWGVAEGTTFERDVEICHDFLNTSPRLDSKGIMVMVN
ncbi:MAG: hypothetical protein Q9218_005749 [Villophora microphyllina]